MACKRNQLETKCCALPPTEIQFHGGYATVPNIFTPNNDGVFDSLHTNAAGYMNYRIEIFKGKKSLFVSEDPSNRWDGYLFTEKKNGFYDRKMKHGFYNFKLEITSLSGEKIEHRGEFCLVTGASARCIASQEGCYGSSEFDGSAFVRNKEDQPENCN